MKSAPPPKPNPSISSSSRSEGSSTIEMKELKSTATKTPVEPAREITNQDDEKKSSATLYLVVQVRLDKKHLYNEKFFNQIISHYVSKPYENLDDAIRSIHMNPNPHRGEYHFILQFPENNINFDNFQGFYSVLYNRAADPIFTPMDPPEVKARKKEFKEFYEQIRLKHNKFTKAVAMTIDDSEKMDNQLKVFQLESIKKEIDKYANGNINIEELHTNLQEFVIPKSAVRKFGLKLFETLGKEPANSSILAGIISKVETMKKNRKPEI